MSCKLVEGKKSKWFPMKELKGGKLALSEGGHIVTRTTTKDSGFIILGESRVQQNASNGFDPDTSILVRELEEGELIEVHYS